MIEEGGQVGVEFWVRSIGNLHEMRAALQRFVVPAGAAAADVTLAANELATNALMYAGGPCQVSGSFPTDRVLRLAVTDVASGPLQLDLAPVERGAVSGRGLAIVAAIASRWGVEPAGFGKTVWFEVDLSAPAAADSSGRPAPLAPG
jgi:hypothetical protein